MYFSTLCNLYCFSLFSPTLVANLGYAAATAQLMSVPPYAVAAVVTIGAGYLSDRMQRRGVLFIGFSLFGMIGYVLLLATTNTIAQYIGIFCAASGVYPLIPLSIAWVANNSGGSTKKSVATAIIISVGNLGEFEWLSGSVASVGVRVGTKPRIGGQGAPCCETRRHIASTRSP
jgi:MFS family permease